MKNMYKNLDKNNSLEKEFKNKKKFVSYLEKKILKFKVEKNEKKFLLNSVNKGFKFTDTNTEPININDKKYKWDWMEDGGMLIILRINYYF
jgi:hypothetical protein